MINSLLLAVQSTAPATPEWSWKVALIMITCNLFAVAIGFYAIPKEGRGKGPALPVDVPDLFAGFGVPELLATASLGHLLGAGMILGLANAGLL